MKTSILLFLFSFSVYGANCSKHPIYCQIKKNQPKIDKKYAMELSNIIYKMHRKYHIPTRIFTAILMQESGYSLEAKGCHNGLTKNPNVSKEIQICLDKQFPTGPAPKRGHFNNCIDNISVHVEVKVCTDFGISQIYFKTAQRFGFNIGELMNNLEYSIEAGAKVLFNLMNKYEAKEADYWVRYNCGTKGTTKRDTCQIYRKMVERYL